MANRSTPTPNMIIPFIKNPKNGINYTSALLSEAPTFDEVQRFAHEISKRLIDKVKYAIDLTPGVGATDVALMNLKRLDGIYAFASNALDAGILEKNLKYVGLDESINVQSDFTPDIVSDILPESVVVIDSSDILMFSDLPNILEGLKKAELIAIRSSQKIRQADLAGFISKAFNDVPSGSTFYFLTYFQWDEQKRKEWRKNLKTFLKGFLSQFVDDENLVGQMLTKPSMDLYETAFTTEAVNPEFNSEKIEMLGDSFLDNCILDYLFERIPNISKGQANELKSLLVRKNFLGKLAVKLSLSEYVLTFKTTKHTNEDVFESFMGATATICKKILPGLNFIVCYAFVEWVYNDVPMDTAENLPTAPAITWVPQSFIKLGFGNTKNPQVFVDESPDPHNPLSTVSTVYISDATLKTLKKYGLNLNTTTLGVASDVDKKASKQNAYYEAYDLLRNAGMTKEWLDKTANRLIFERPTIAPYYKDAMKKAKSLGYVDISFVNSSAQSSYGNQISSLVGITKEGTKKRLAVGQGIDRNESMGLAIQNFVQNK